MGKIKGFLKNSLRSLLPGHDPDFIIIGAQKAGTSSLHYYLDQYPNLIGSVPKEVHFFEKHINFPGRDQNWYRKHFVHMGIGARNKLFFETSPSYIYYETAAKNISKYYPSIKLILILREPISRAFSAWNMYRDIFQKDVIASRIGGGTRPGEVNLIVKHLMNGRTAFPSFPETVKIELNLTQNGGEDEEPSVLRRGLYYQQIMNYLKYFDRGQILILGFNSLIERPKDTCNQVLDFLKLDGFKENELKIEVKNKRSYESPLSARDRAMLSEFYQEPNELLFKFLGTDNPW